MRAGIRLSGRARTIVLLFALPAALAGSGGCALTGRDGGSKGDLPLASASTGDPAAVVVRSSDTATDERTGPPPSEPGVPDEVGFGPDRGARPSGRPGRDPDVDPDVSRAATGREDTNLGRSRAQKRGEGGGPTRSEEREDEAAGEDYQTDLLVRALGLEDSPYNVFGWAQGGFTGNPSRPRSRESFGVNPNTLANTWIFQQFVVAVEKPLDPGKRDGYDFGFRVDNLFGSDWTQLHMVGLFDDLDRARDFGWEPTQFYGEFHLPWLTPGGVDLKVGRFFSLAGYEDAYAPGRPLNSGGYLFGYSQPFTLVGAMTTWHVTDRLNLFNGLVNGWDRWLNARERWGYAGGLVYDSADSRTNATLTVNAGPNQFPSFFRADYAFTPNGVTNPPFLAGRKNVLYNQDRAFLLTATLIHEWTERLTVVAEADYGSESNVPGLGVGGGPVNGQWYGASGWSLYSFTDRLTGVYRAEVFRDNGGVRTGFNATYYEMTLGLIAKPRAWLWFRPEVRFDWAGGARPYDDGTKGSQLTLGFDTIFLF